MDKTLETVGKLLTKEAKRDAVHFALAPVIAVETLTPGHHVALQGDTEHVGYARRLGQSCVGIVDPFLPGRIEKGQRFWLFLYPATITSLRHEWTHPAFEPPPATLALAQVAAKAGYTPDNLLRMLEQEEWSDYISMGDDEEAASRLNGLSDELWDAYEAATGRKTKRPYFSCAC